jgi:hypothetical protein
VVYELGETDLLVEEQHALTVLTLEIWVPWDVPCRFRSLHHVALELDDHRMPTFASGLFLA